MLKPGTKDSLHEWNIFLTVLKDWKVRMTTLYTRNIGLQLQNWKKLYISISIKTLQWSPVQYKQDIFNNWSKSVWISFSANFLTITIWHIISNVLKIVSKSILSTLKNAALRKSRQVFNYLEPILIYISLWVDCLSEIRKIAVCFLWLSLPGHYRVTDELLLAQTT